MQSFLLVVIYLSFVSLGLPDFIFGSAWPVMHEQLNVPMSYAGIITIIVSIGTILSSLLSDRTTKKLGAGLVTAISVLFTALALFGFSLSRSFIFLCLWAVPYGLGAGAVDAALNNYVALHYASRHMNWLHCCWGIGATVGPYIMGYCLTRGYGWYSGYRSIFAIQILLTLIIFASLPLWKRPHSETGSTTKPLSLPAALRIRGVKFVLFAFFGYLALETTAGLWASSFLVESHNIKPETAAQFTSLFFLGITCGRFLSGFFADRIGDKLLIRFGIAVIIAGIVLLGISGTAALAGLVIIGLGCAPIYPAIIHSTPANFGQENSQAIIGIQMASAYAGMTFMPPLFGLLADKTSIGLYPLYLSFFAILALVMTELLNGVVRVSDLNKEQENLFRK